MLFYSKRALHFNLHHNKKHSLPNSTCGNFISWMSGWWITLRGFFIGPVKDAVTLVSKDDWNVALCRCYHGLLKQTLKSFREQLLIITPTFCLRDLILFKNFSVAWMEGKHVLNKQNWVCCFFNGKNMIQPDAKKKKKKNQMIWAVGVETLALT